ncbi:TylF/MycF/NovP-related O-methyltransferase [Terrisporobacter sp.]
MDKIMIFGAGQGGRMISSYMSADCHLLGFIDNNSLLWNKKINDLKIYSLKEAIEMVPDIIVITVLNREGAIEIETQLGKEGYRGKIFNINEFRNYIDIRLSTLRLIAQEMNQKKLEGQVAELGVYKGKFSAEINRLFPSKNIYLFDTFEGFYKEDVEIEEACGYSRAKEGDFSDTSIDLVKDKLPHKDKALFFKGYFPYSIKGELPSFCFVSIDTDLYKPTYAGLSEFYPKLVKGGVIIIHDYNSTQFPGVKRAVKRFCQENDVYILPICDMHGSAIIMK